MQVPKLFSPGPVMVRDDVRQSLLHYDVCHRGAEFEAMFGDTQDRIRKLLRADERYFPVIISGSGTSANEAVLSSLFNEGDAVMLVHNGLFGERLLEIIQKYDIPLVDARFEWAKYPDMNVIEKLIEENPAIKVVAMVYHETSTGMINPVREVGRLCRKTGKLFFTDAVSAVGAQNVFVEDDNIDIVTSVGGKCIGAYPGSAFVCMRDDVFKSITTAQCKNVYLSLYKHYQSAVLNCQTPNTPNITLFWALNKALKNIEEEGLENRVAGRERCAAIIRDGARALGLRLLLADHMASTVTSMFAPDGVDALQFLDEMERRGYVLYIGKGKYKDQGMFQVATMGEISEDDCRAFLAEMKDCLEEMKPAAK